MELSAALIVSHLETREAENGYGFVTEEHGGYKLEWCRRGKHTFLCASGLSANIAPDCGDPSCGR